MLDVDTKRRIDTARDILVGKVPDPKSQVEQITIALIYKFMDDLDAESEEFGGERTFFAGDFARYGWAKLMHPSLGGYETLNLYAEAITRMPENPGIPPLFRDIFNNAYLPYRDPETLRAFLKVIDEFTYDHSERLGDAFEYLLSVLGAQGDAGQFRTPRHIIDFIVAVVDPKKDETVLDPACGTAGFLISAYKHILAANTDAHGQSALTPDDRGRLVENFKGYDISPDMVRLSLVNLYLHGFREPHIYEYDTLTSDERWNEYADVILANPPFMSPRGGIRPHNRFSVKSTRSEVLFVDYLAEHLSPEGRAGVIVPEGIIFQTQNAYRQLRKMLVEDCLVAVISLPAGVFNPYSGVKTSILILDRALAKRTDSVAFFKVEKDGFNLGAQRRPIDQNDLLKVLEDLRTLIHCWMTSDSVEEFNLTSALIVGKERISEDGDYNLSGERYREGETNNDTWPMKTIGELCQINPQQANPEDLYPGSYFNYIDISCVENETGTFLGANKVESMEAPSRARRLVAPGDVLISTVRPNLRAFTILKNLPERAVASTGFSVLRSDPQQLLPGFLISTIRNENAVKQMIGMMGKGSYPSINQKDVSSIEIPVPPLEVQQELVAEIEGYQKVIDGARAVVENYRPRIAVDPEWPTVALGKVCEIIMGQSPPGNTYNTEGRGVPLINGPVEFGPKPFSKTVITQYTTAPTRMCMEGDLILCVRGSTTGRMNIAACPSCIGRGVAAIRSESSQSWVNLVISTFRDRIHQLGAGSTFPNVTKKELASLLVPFPAFDIQQQIVQEFETESSLVAANYELIESFDRKIHQTVGRWWGKEASVFSDM